MRTLPTDLDRVACRASLGVLYRITHPMLRVTFLSHAQAATDARVNASRSVFTTRLASRCHTDHHRTVCVLSFALWIGGFVLAGALFG